MSFISQNFKRDQQKKKKPPPRPPPPNFSKYKSKSTLNINEQVNNLIEWSPPNSPRVERSYNFGGSVSSSFSSSTCSLASSKKSFECDNPLSNNLLSTNFNSKTNFYQQGNSTFFFSSERTTNESVAAQSSASKAQTSFAFHPTIIRAQTKNESKMKVFKDSKSTSDSPSPPMPSVPPPSPPKDVASVEVACGIALFDYQGMEPGDLPFQAGDIVILIRRLNKDWYYGRVLDKEGMFPANFIEVQVPLVETEKDDNIVMALYEFTPQMPTDLSLRPGQLIKVIKKINNNWLYGESEGCTGQFPSNFVDRIPVL